jgi:hypothetical protein
LLPSVRMSKWLSSTNRDIRYFVLSYSYQFQGDLNLLGSFPATQNPKLASTTTIALLNPCATDGPTIL